MYKQGDIVVVRFPFTDGSDFKKRPVMIISNETVNKTNDYLVVQITSKYNNDNLSVNISDDDCLALMPLKSFIRIHKIFTIHTNLVITKITEAKPAFIEHITDKACSIIKQ